LAVLKLAVSGVLALAKLGFLDFIAGGFDTGRFVGLPLFCETISSKSFYWVPEYFYYEKATLNHHQNFLLSNVIWPDAEELFAFHQLIWIWVHLNFNETYFHFK
jgi:hypothetical protein